jgi:ATP-dependent DNA ligase
MPVTEDAALLYETWTATGGEAIVLKNPTSVYRPGLRSAACVKLKPPDARGDRDGGSAERVRWGDWGEAVVLEMRYRHPRTGAVLEIQQAVRVPRDETFAPHIGDDTELMC